jgi:RNA polymerase sigma factor (sigma-70 family)
MDLDDTIAQLDEALIVHDALATLPDNCREILDRFFARDESYRHIGEALDLPPGTIASRISRCLVKLRGELEGRNPASAESGG